MFLGFPSGSDGKESACNEEDPGSIPGLGRSPEEEMATHSSILACRIPWTEEPGGLQSMGSQRVGQDCSDLAHNPLPSLSFPCLGPSAMLMSKANARVKKERERKI